jgi:hypothetical protein
VFGWASFYKSIMGKQEILLVFILFFASVISIACASYSKTEFLSYWIVEYCLLLRVFRLSVVFPQIAKFQRILFITLNSFLPVLAMVLCFLLFAAVTAKISFGHIYINYGDGLDFLTTHYHFQDYYHSYITLLAIGTVRFLLFDFFLAFL